MAHQDTESNSFETVDTVNSRNKYLENSDLLNGNLKTVHNKKQTDNFKHSDAKCCCCAFEICQEVLANNKSELEKNVFDLKEMLLDLKDEIMKMKNLLEQKNKIPMVTYSEDPLNCQISRENDSIRNECKRSHGSVSHQIRNDSTRVYSTDFMTGTRSTKIQLNNICEDDTGLKTVHNTSTVGGNTELFTSSRGRCTVIDPSIPSRERLFSSETIFRDDEEPEQTLDCLKLPDPSPCLRNETDAKSLINLQEKCFKTLAGNTDNNFGIPEKALSSGYPMSSASSKEMTSAGSSLFEKVSFENSDYGRDLELPLSVTATNCNCNDENLDVPEMDNQSSVSPATFHQASTCCESLNPATNSTLPTFLKSIKLEEIEIDSENPTSNLLQIEDALPSFLRHANESSSKQFSDNVFDYVNLKQYEVTKEYQEPDENSSYNTIPQSTKQAEEKTVNKYDGPCHSTRLEETTLNFVTNQGKNEHFLGCLFKQSDPVFHNIHVEVLVVGNDGILRQVDPLTELFTSQDFCAEKERSFSESVCELNEESVNCYSIETEVVQNGENVLDLSIADDGVKENAFSESNISPSNKDGIGNINKDCIIDLNNIQNNCSPTERKSKKNHMKKKRKKQIGKSYNQRTLPAPESTSLSSLNHSTERPVSAQRATFLKRRRSSKQSTFFSSSYTREKKSCSAALHLAIYDSGFGSRTQSLEGCKSEFLNEISQETIPLSKIAAGCFGETFEHKNSVHCSKQQQSKTGVKIKVCASKLRSLCKTYGKQMMSFFKDKGVRTLKSIVRELYIEHRSLKVFGLGSYFDRLNRGESLSVQERMQYEWLRLASFQHYSGNGNALSLARNGFYHDPTDGPTSTRCYLCEARHSTWEYFDNIEVEHRRQSPDCPFHSNRSEESTNVSISYDTTSQSHRAPATSTPSVHSTLSSPGTASTGSASLSQTQTTSQNIYQPQENDENRQHSLLALPNSRSYRALGRSGETAYSHLTTPPRRNNIVPGSSSTNASIDGFASSVPTSTATNTVSSSMPTSIATNNVSSSVPTSIATSTSSVSFRQPISAGAFGGFNAPTSSSISTSSSTISTSTSQSVSAPAVAAASSLQRPSQPLIGGGSLKAAVSSHLRPSQTPIGGGGRTDPTITVVVDNAKHPDYRELDARINSYQGWPDYLDQTARQMAEAGFFFVGVADFTRCFCCGGGLRNWEPGDDPMLEHTRWFPRCEYVNKLKGERYVAAVQRRHQQHMEEQQRQQQELARNRDANRNPPDPMSTEAAAVLREMGYQQERIKDAILTVRRQIGVPDVTTQQVLAWLLDQHEARSLPTSSRSSPTRDLGVKVNASLPSSSIQTSTQSSVINSTHSVSTSTSAALTGSNSSVVSSTSTATGAGSQQSGSSTSTTSSSGSAIAGSKPTSQAGSKENGAKEGKSLGKQSAASGGESEEEFKSAEETLSPDNKPSKKKNRKKNKAKSGAKPSDAPSKLNVVDTQALKEENEKLRDMQTCKICMERLVNTTLLPCGHLVCCDVCAARLNRCPICRKRIKGTVKTFIS